MNVVFKIEKDKTKEQVVTEILSQVNLIKNIELVNKIKKYLIEPSLHFAIWYYGKKESKYPAWLILKSKDDDTGILYSEYGFAFGNWGLIKLSDHPFHFGPDFHWFSTLEEAFLNSFMSKISS
jgi:hypothetical protein